MKRNSRRNSEQEEFSALAEINVTPLVDVFLVLLVIFMITAPVIKTALEMGLPEAKTAISDPSQGMTIKVLKDGTLWIDNERVAVEAFPTRFQTIWSELDNNGNRKPVFLAADEGVPYGEIVFIIDEMRNAGVVDLGLITKQAEKAANR